MGGGERERENKQRTSTYLNQPLVPGSNKKVERKRDKEEDRGVVEYSNQLPANRGEAATGRQ